MRAVRWDLLRAHVGLRLLAEKQGHKWLNAVFCMITLPDPIHLKSADSEMFKTATANRLSVELS